MYVAFSK